MEGRAAEKVRRVVDIGLTVASDRRAPTVQAFQVCRGPADSLKVDTLLMCCIPSNGTESQPAGRRGGGLIIFGRRRELDFSRIFVSCDRKCINRPQCCPVDLSQALAT